MNITIDTKAKTITVNSSTTFEELFDSLQRMFSKEELNKYTIISKTEYQTLLNSRDSYPTWYWTTTV